MTTVLIVLLALDAVLHGFLIVRFGAAQNMPFLVYCVVDAVLAVLVILAVPYVLWAVLVLSVIGLIGLTVTFNSVPRDKTLDRVIWGFDAAIVLCSAYLLFIA